MTALAQLRAMEVATLRRYCQPLEDLTVTEWSDRERVLPESSTSPGRFRSDVVPYARRWMDLMADPAQTMIVLCWGSQLIKALDCETPIPTPNGWTTMGALREGDVVFGADGQPTAVIAATEVRYERPCYAVDFDSGETIVADESHLWRVISRHRIDGGDHPRRQGWSAPLRTVDLIGRRSRRIPVTSALQLPDVTLPLPAYVLGAWLGDGHTESPRITADARDGVIEQVLAEWPRAIIRDLGGDRRTILLSPRRSASMTCGRGHGKRRYGDEVQCPTCTGLRQRANRSGTSLAPVPRATPGAASAALESLGVVGRKHIPVQYLRASEPQRWALLQGLMDTDGTCTRSGYCQYTSTLEVLARDVAELLCTLGLKPLVREGSAVLNGRRIGPKWVVGFTAYSDQPVFRLARKQGRLKDRDAVNARPSESGARSVRAVRPVSSRPVRCIQVAAADGMFLAGRQMIPTHNSTILENAMAYRICRQPSPMMLVRPKTEDAEWWMKKRFVPMVRQTPALAERVQLKRSTNAEENSATLRMKSFGGGFLLAAAATSAAELASWSVPFLAMDEVDRFEPLPAEGHPVEIALIRQSAAEVRTAVLTSTPGLADTSVIWPYLEAGTFERCHVPCPHCGHMQHLIWGGPNEPTGFKWASGKPEGAQYLCIACAALIDYSELPGMLAAHEWVPSNPEGTYPSSHLPGWYSPFAGSSWGQLATEFVKAKGKSLSLQVFVNTRKAECWSETVSRVDTNELEGRLEPMEFGKVPEGVGLVTLGVDGQKRYLQWEAWGWGAGLESWLIASGIIEGNTETEPGTPGGPWEELDRLWNAGFTHVNGRPVPVRRTFIDSGFATSQVYRYAKRRASRQVYPCKGVGGEGPFVARPSVQGRDRTLLYAVRVDKGKDEFLRNQIQENTVGPGYVHLPDWISPEELGGLVSEVRKRKPGPHGKISYVWIPKKGAPPNEPLDCRIYARAALEAEGMRVIAHLGAMAAELAKPPTDAETTERASEAAPPRPRPSARRNYVSEW